MVRIAYATLVFMEIETYANLVMVHVVNVLVGKPINVSTALISHTLFLMVFVSETNLVQLEHIWEQKEYVNSAWNIVINVIRISNAKFAVQALNSSNKFMETKYLACVQLFVEMV